MNFMINANNNSMNFVRNINSGWSKLTNSIVKLSSGLKINSASDGPATLVISEQLRSRIASLNQEIKNIDAQIYKNQYASSTVGQLRSDLTELRTLAIGAANEGGNNDAAQDAYQNSADLIISNYNYKIDMADYNGSAILDGSSGSVANIDYLENMDLSSAESASAAINQIDQAISEVDSVQVDLGAKQANQLEPEKSNLEITKSNLIAAESNLRDLDYASEFTNMITEMFKIKANIAILSHSYLTSKSVIELLNTK